jgi:hypothetical protein
MEKTLTKTRNQYAFSRPVTIPVAKVLNTFTAIEHVFRDNVQFKSVYGATEPHGHSLWQSLTFAEKQRQVSNIQFLWVLM